MSAGVADAVFSVLYAKGRGRSHHAVFEDMETVRAEIPAELVVAAGLDADNLSAEATRLLALELYRGDRVSLGRAAELCHLPTEPVHRQFAGRHNVPLPLSAPMTWRKIAKRWNGSACDCRF